jgi:hypothetical protein
VSLRSRSHHVGEMVRLGCADDRCGDDRVLEHPGQAHLRDTPRALGRSAGPRRRSPSRCRGTAADRTCRPSGCSAIGWCPAGPTGGPPFRQPTGSTGWTLDDEGPRPWRVFDNRSGCRHGDRPWQYLSAARRCPRGRRGPARRPRAPWLITATCRWWWMRSHRRCRVRRRPGWGRPMWSGRGGLVRRCREPIRSESLRPSCALAGQVAPWHRRLPVIGSGPSSRSNWPGAMGGSALPAARSSGMVAPGVSFLAEGVIAAELARGDGSIATLKAVHSGLAMTTIAMLGSEEQRPNICHGWRPVKFSGPLR